MAPTDSRIQSLLDSVGLDVTELEFQPIRAQGAGGQHVNKVSSAVHLRFDIRASALSEDVKSRLLALSDQRVSLQGVIVIKAQAHRHLERNREDAVRRLVEIVDRVGRKQPVRKLTAPARRVRRLRVDSKTRRGRLKRLRVKPDLHD